MLWDADAADFFGGRRFFIWFIIPRYEESLACSDVIFGLGFMRSLLRRDDVFFSVVNNQCLSAYLFLLYSKKILRSSILPVFLVLPIDRDFVPFPPAAGQGVVKRIVDKYSIGKYHPLQ
jgi:hypothetical protein